MACNFIADLNIGEKDYSKTTGENKTSNIKYDCLEKIKDHDGIHSLSNGLLASLYQLTDRLSNSDPKENIIQWDNPKVNGIGANRDVIFNATAITKNGA